MRPFIWTLATLSALTACGNVRLQTPEELGREVISEAYRTQSRQHCAQGSDPATQLRCEKQARDSMQEYRRSAPKAARE